MKEYIVTFDGPNNSPQIRGEFIRCKGCKYLSTDDGFPWCVVYIVPRNENGYCNLAKPKERI